MGFVVYDLETTGLNKRFDQILQFAAVRTDDNLNIQAHEDFSIRLLPNVVPSPEALHITGTSIADLDRLDRLSHYDGVRRIYETFDRWSPSMFLGFNSISFDEEFIRQAFYTCLLQPIFLTNINGSARGDALKLARVVAVMRPQVLAVPVNDEGRRVFSLGELARANGIDPGRGHDAMADVQTTLALCRQIRSGAPEIWSMLMRFANKTAVRDFVAAEDAFAMFEYQRGVQDVHCVTRVGINPGVPNTHYCLDLTCDVDALRRMSAEELLDAVQSERRPIHKLEIQKSPLLAPTWDIDPCHWGDFVEDDLIRVAQGVRSDEAFMSRLTQAAIATEKVFPPSVHVEQQIYGGSFTSDAEVERCRRFHQATWEDRLAMVTAFPDIRFRRLAQRLVYFERPDLLDPALRTKITHEIERRACEASDEPWRTIPKALDELAKLGGAAPFPPDHPSHALRERLSGRLSRWTG